MSAADLQSIFWWFNVGALALASIIDVRCRRIPNWLVGPFLGLGIVSQCLAGGLHGATRSLAGMLTAVLLFGIPCFIGAMGMGDLKLAAGVGTWLGAGQMLTAFVVTSIVGGLIAVFYAWYQGSLGACLDRTSNLMVDFSKGKVRKPIEGVMRNQNLSIPYAPAIAAGALFSFFAR